MYSNNQIDHSYRQYSNGQQQRQNVIISFASYHHQHHYCCLLFPTAMAFIKTMLVTIVLATFILMNSFMTIEAYSSGAPNNQKVCTTMIPGHGSRQNTPAPYKLTTNIINDRRHSQQIISIELQATAHVTFAGFIVQALRNHLGDDVDNQIIDDGYFERLTNNTITKSCLSHVHNTWTHSDGEPKTRVLARWIPYSQTFNGSLYFQATVVQVKQAYWNEIRSEPIYFYRGHSTDESMYSKLIDNQPIDQPMSGAKMQSFDIDYDQCLNRLCIGLANNDDDDNGNCIGSKSCRALMSVWKNENGENNFSLQAKPSKQSSSMANSYYSMALSDDNRMGNDFVVDCLVNSNGRVMVDLSHNIGKSNEPLSKRERMDILQEQTGQFIDGIVHCKWRLKRQFRIGNKDYDISKRSYHIFLATGSYDNDGEQNHKEYHDLKLRTSEPVNLSSIIAGSLQVKDLTVLIRVHGCLMLIAWFGTVPIAITLARYFKQAWPGRLLCGVQIWDLHQIFGSIAFTLAILQPIGALFRPHPGTSKRWLFNWAHWFGGTAGQITAAAAILLASKLKLANLSDSFLYIAIVWILCHVVLHLLFQFHSFCTSSSSSSSSMAALATSNGLKSPDIAMHEMHNHHNQRHIYGNNNHRHNQSSSSSSSIRYFLLAIYILLIGFLATILAIFIAIPSMIKNLI
ncbi:DOMON domain-containing protein frrs1L, variant 2 [Dermatophagoides farinae]|uniref:DOMON domain-containing protein frrs1L, variant 2 n=1 Tax=Dermatophagoides farinae TaxID=6954 RepID=A0A922L1Z5_DERFA|nr:DOMON domain-containing protein frrs1L, variant 2 [Dermatophagoides farinae]